MPKARPNMQTLAKIAALVDDAYPMPTGADEYVDGAPDMPTLAEFCDTVKAPIAAVNPRDALVKDVSNAIAALAGYDEANNVSPFEWNGIRVRPIANTLQLIQEESQKTGVGEDRLAFKAAGEDGRLLRVFRNALRKIHRDREKANPTHQVTP